MKKRTIALLTGGTTDEIVVSLKSAANVLENLDSDKFQVYKIMLTKDGWYYESRESGEKFQVNRNNFTLLLSGSEIKFEGVFIVMHGSPGEDGRLQGYLDMLNIPYTSCNALTSALTMNKSYTKAIVSDIKQLNIAKSAMILKDSDYSTAMIKHDLKFPCFVKPCNGGSSLNASKIEHPEDLEKAIEQAFHEDSQILIEEAIVGREFTVGVVKFDGEIRVLPVTEIHISGHFFDFDSKYTPGATSSTTPAALNEETRKKITRIATDVFIKLNCRGVVRIDFILSGDQEDFYFLEVNTIPGLTSTSYVPKQIESTGMKMKDFFTKLIEETIG